MSVQESPSSSAASTSAAKPDGGPAHRPGLILAFLCLAGFMTFLDVSIVNVALPTIEDELHISQTALQYVVTTYGMLLGGFLLLTGRLADTLGRRRMLQTGLVLFAVSSLLAGLAQNSAMLIGARAGQGLAAAFMATAALSLLTNNFEEGPARNKALGVWGALSGVAAVAGVTLGGLLTDGPGWRWIFFINVPIGLVGALVAPMIVGESRSAERTRSFDVAGAVVLTAGLILLIFTLGQTVDDSDVPMARIYGGFALSALLLIGFLLIERRAAAPLMPLRVFRRPSLRAANIIAILLLGTCVSLFFFASLFMQQVLDYSAITTGLAYVPLALTTAVGAGIASQVVTKVAAKPVLMTGLTLVGTGMLLLWRAPSDAAYLVDLLPAFIICGLGLGASFVPLQISAFAGSEEHESGLAAGLINTSQEIGGALGLAVAATYAFRRIDELEAQSKGVPELVDQARTTVFHDAFLISAGFAAAGLLVTLVLLPLTRAKDLPTGAPVA
ncbi:MFS transporter [Streptomyces sp. NE06-03E]|uniref:MFS transporter n=3 Tax=Streptomyces TaxID=1883 RepID=A0AAU1LSC1_9ACTN|nr:MULTISPECIES: MFS transporter [Streptomyces]WSS62463.1 MFS transporter [Streptomyces sp. NBC_01177]WSS76502.1 MFS transporter [Streptomyces sp. NBC_01174]MBL1287141.1 MFS transporter [Streptomyces silvae]MDX3058436.1 MFS transporter [Streptomyces sp. NE06-03E]MDX3328236.1 MFS transporter [Streptomyces sp. ME02-6979-3A]